jgi:hypothetical protein
MGESVRMSDGASMEKRRFSVATPVLPPYELGRGPPGDFPRSEGRGRGYP